MANPGVSVETLRERVKAVEHFGSIAAAARALGMPRSTLQHQIIGARTLGLIETHAPPPPPKEFEAPELPDDLPTAADLIAQRKKAFARKAAAREARKLIPITIKVDGPFGVCHFGDPHVDDNGTDLALLERHVQIVNKTPALFAGNVGDFSNNWIGRLARLYAEQSISAREAWVLVEWLIQSMDWLYLVGGNHDAWSGAGDPIQWIASHVGVRYTPNGVRLSLNTPNGRSITVNARHDFRGHSMWNPAHGVGKAVQMGWRDHILTCGHTHQSGYMVLKDPATGLISHAIRVGSYKTYDRYADEKGLPDQTVFVAPVTIIDPQWPDDDPRLITTIFEPEMAADFLTWLRKKRGYGKAA